ncbi:MAG: extracellular solute-binding protein [Chloroflexi bacterium]|nr:extracellular solute-binding protein [Chloroflexota bacterium]
MIHRRRLILLAALILSACQPATVTPTAVPSATDAPPATSTPKVDDSIQIQKEALKGVTIQVWTPWFGVEQNLFDSQVQDFNQTNEWGIKVQSTSQINYTQLYQNVAASLNSPDQPDLAIAFPEHALEWNASGSVVNMNNYVNDPRYGLSSADIKDIPPVFWNQDSVNGTRVGAPAERSARFILYNVSWARELGFDSSPQTSSDFQQQACRAHQTMLTDTDKTNDAYGGWLIDTNPIATLSQLKADQPLDWSNLVNDADSITALSWMTAFGGGVLEGNGYRFLTPKNIAAFTFIKQLYDDGCAWTAQPNADLPAAFASRKAIFATAGLEELPDYARAMAAADNSDEWTVLSFPGDAQTGLIVYGSSYVVLKSTPEKQLASWLFVRWLLSPENQTKWVQVTNLFPLRTSSLDALSDYKNTHPQWAAAVALLPQAQMQPQLASWRNVRIMLGDGFNSMFRLNIPAGQVAAVLAQMESISRDLSK